MCIYITIYHRVAGGPNSPQKTSSLPPCYSCCQTDHATSAINYHIYWPDIPSHQHTGQHVSDGKYFILAPLLLLLSISVSNPNQKWVMLQSYHQ